MILSQERQAKQRQLYQDPVSNCQKQEKQYTYGMVAILDEHAQVLMCFAFWPSACNVVSWSFCKQLHVMVTILDVLLRELSCHRAKKLHGGSCDSPPQKA